MQFVSWQTVGHALNLAGLPPGTEIHDPVFNGGVNGSLWSIRFEFMCYLGVLFMGLTGFFKHRKAIIVIFLMAIAANFIIHFYNLTPGGKILGKIFGYPVFWARLLPIFLSGVLLQVYRDKIRVNGRLALIATLVALGLTQVKYGVVFLVPLCLSYITIYLAFTKRVRLHNAAAYGDFSYGIYLYSFPIQQLVMWKIGHAVSPYLLFLISAPLSLLFGIASWHLVERWFVVNRRPKAQLNEASIDTATCSSQPLQVPECPTPT